MLFSTTRHEVIICIPFLSYTDHNRFTALFPEPTRWAGARRELLDFMVQGKINRGRHTDHPNGRHSIRTKQCPPSPSPIFCIGRMPFLPPNQQCQSTEGKLHIQIREKTPEFSSTVLPAPSHTISCTDWPSNVPVTCYCFYRCPDMGITYRVGVVNAFKENYCIFSLIQMC